MTATGGRAEWDRRYGDAPIWSGKPNGALVVETSPMWPGRALDVGCGEGGDAVWLASRGWSVTAVDISEVAISRARQVGDRMQVVVDWRRADLLDTAVPAASFDLVSVLYPALLRTEEARAERAVLDAVALGGALLAVWHAPPAPAFSRSHGFDPDDYVQPEDLRRLLDDDWIVDVDEVRPRVDPPHPGSPFTHDHVLRVRRRP